MRFHVSRHKKLKNAVSKASSIGIKPLFQFLRLVLMGATKGPSIHELIEILGADEARKRIEKQLDS